MSCSKPVHPLLLVDVVSLCLHFARQMMRILLSFLCLDVKLLVLEGFFDFLFQIPGEEYFLFRIHEMLVYFSVCNLIKTNQQYV
jgi:hypothetical protein